MHFASDPFLVPRIAEHTPDLVDVALRRAVVNVQLDDAQDECAATPTATTDWRQGRDWDQADERTLMGQPPLDWRNAFVDPKRRAEGIDDDRK